MQLSFNLFALITKADVFLHNCPFFAYLIKKNNGRAVKKRNETAQTVKY